MKTLVEQGYEAYGVDFNLNPTGSKVYGNTFELNINSQKAADIVIYNNIDTILHFAASADVGLSVTNPELFYFNNIGNTSAFLTNLIEKGWKGNFIFSSTAAVYEESENKVWEGSSLNSPNPYGKSKLACEWLLQDVSKAFDINAVTFRYFNVAGAWDDCGDHIRAGHIISRLCDTTYQHDSFILNGTDKNTPDGTCIRDYLHVRDVCDAHLHALDYLNTHGGYHTFNLGTGIGWSNRQIIDAFKRFSGRIPNIAKGPGRPGDPDHLVAAADKFVNLTGYRYNHSSLENIISTAWQYYLNKME